MNSVLKSNNATIRTNVFNDGEQDQERSECRMTMSRTFFSKKQRTSKETNPFARRVPDPVLSPD